MISKKPLTEEEEEERRTKQSLDSPQTIEANNKYRKLHHLKLSYFETKELIIIRLNCLRRI